MRSKGQSEMIGLVFIVIILVVGIVMYLRFSSLDESPNVERESQGAKSFLVALKETSLPQCGGMSFERVAAACLGGEVQCTTRDPCGELQQTVDMMNRTLLRQGFKYNLSITGTNIMSTSSCNSADRRVELLMAPRVPIVYAGGGAQAYLTLAVCR